MSEQPIGVMGSSLGDGGAGPASPAGNGSSNGAGASPASPARASSGANGATQDGSVDGQPVPYQRFQEINEKLGKLKWAEGYSNPQEVEQAMALRQWAARDPKGLYAYLRSQLEAHGHIEREAAPQPRAVPQAPAPDYVDPQSGLKVYSAERAQELVRFYVDQVKQELAGEINPVKQVLGGLQVHARARGEAQRIVSNAEANWPHFKDHKAAIFEAMGKDPNLSLSDAYITVVVPRIGQKERQGLLNELDQKPGATTASPASQQGGGGEDLTKLSFGTLLKREFRKHGLMTR